MARRNAVKTKTGQKNKISTPQETPAASIPAKSSGGLSTMKLLIVIVIVLAFIYGPSLFKKGAILQAPSKTFLVKEIIQFSGDDVQGSPFFANDIAAVGPNELAITDNLGGQVLLCDFKGKLIRKWGKNGDGPKDFREPSGVVSDGKGRLFVLDTLNGAIKIFNLSGKMQGSIDLSRLGYFPTPRRLGWGGGNFLVTNAFDTRLFRVTPKGALLSTWGEKNGAQGGLWGTTKPIVDGTGRYYAGESNMKESRVRIFDSVGNVVREIKTGVPAESLALDAKGRLFVASYGEPSKVFDANGNWLGDLSDAAKPTAFLNQVAGIEILPNGLILTCGGNVVTLYQLMD